MLNALQKLVTEKKLDSGEQIVGVLEQWKTGVRGQLDNGYFNRTYGEGANGEAHKVGDYDEGELESILGLGAKTNIDYSTPAVDGTSTPKVKATTKKSLLSGILPGLSWLGGTDTSKKST